LTNAQRLRQIDCQENGVGLTDPPPTELSRFKLNRYPAFIDGKPNTYGVVVLDLDASQPRAKR
jgi:hypothetical protein